jgi:co-chaperonin GroES (HSP10)
MGTPAPTVSLMEKSQPSRFKAGDVSFYALGDRVIVREDEFKSGYECRTCSGHGKVVCSNCDGTGHSKVNAHAKCSACHGETTQTCPDCEGKGGVLIVPEQSQRRPSSGMIVSVGEDCKVLKEGENVLYSNFAGYAIDLDRAGISTCLRILHEKEILCRVEGHLELRTLRNKTDITTV